MEKTAKITKTYPPKPWNGQNGTIYFRAIELDNGDKGQIGTKEVNPEWLKEGQELTYTIEINESGNKIKKVQKKPQGGGYGRTPEERKEIVRQSSLKVAIEFYAAFGRPDGKTVSPQDVMTMAETFTDYVMKH